MNPELIMEIIEEVPVFLADALKIYNDIKAGTPMSADLAQAFQDVLAALQKFSSTSK